MAQPFERLKSFCERDGSAVTERVKSFCERMTQPFERLVNGK